AINMASELKRPLFPGFGPRASSSLLRHDWPGHVRELKNAVERSIYRSTDVDDVILSIAFDPFDSPYVPADAQPVTATSPARTKRPPLLPTNLVERLQDTERELLRAALEKARFNQRRAADLLGLSYDQLRGKMKKYDLASRPGS
ncbi:MAG: helix-turn-helix domain-containing protein, partial [Woeseiaceae bacterium]